MTNKNQTPEELAAVAEAAAQAEYEASVGQKDGVPIREGPAKQAGSSHAMAPAPESDAKAAE
ncbi:MAG TPA: hypothetical protein VK672_07520 [Solirubrobacteraceae bacterium]|jgi:hypothetical protein|nr:hypothetical protein [Solirubrobacteraceae bacterium]